MDEMAQLEAEKKQIYARITEINDRLLELKVGKQKMELLGLRDILKKFTYYIVIDEFDGIPLLTFNLGLPDSSPAGSADFFPYSLENERPELAAFAKLDAYLSLSEYMEWVYILETEEQLREVMKELDELGLKRGLAKGISNYIFQV